MNKDINLDDINIEEYEKINVSLDEIKKKKMKKRLVGIIKRKRNIKKVLMAAVAMILIISSTNISSISALAKNIPVFNRLYKQLGFSEKYLPKSQYIGQSIEENGVRVTIDNIVGTKHMIMLSIKVEKIDGTFLSDDERTLPIMADFDKRKDIGSSGGSKKIDDKTEMMVLSLSSIEEFPRLGELNLDVYGPKGKFNERFNLSLDFTESYNEVLEKNFFVSENTEGANVKKLVATTLGAILEVENYATVAPTELIIKIDDKLFSQTGGGYGNEKKMYLCYPDIVYEDIENAKTISVIEKSGKSSVNTEDIQSFSEEEIDKIKRDFEIEENVLKEKINLFPKGEKENIEYIKEITFNNGNKAEIYDIERGNGIVRVYIKGQDKKQTLEVAISIMSCDINEFNYEDQNKVIENNDGYIVEFNDRNTEKFKIDFKHYDLEHDGSTIGREILLGSY